MERAYLFHSFLLRSTILHGMQPCREQGGRVAERPHHWAAIGSWAANHDRTARPSQELYSLCRALGRRDFSSRRKTRRRLQDDDGCLRKSSEGDTG